MAFLSEFLKLKYEPSLSWISTLSQGIYLPLYIIFFGQSSFTFFISKVGILISVP